MNFTKCTNINSGAVAVSPSIGFLIMKKSGTNDSVIDPKQVCRLAFDDGQSLKSYQLPDKPIYHGHDVSIDEDKNLYICQWNANNTPPLKLESI